MEQKKMVWRPTQAEVAYVPLSTTGGKACSTCRWFSMQGEYGPYCHLVENWPQDIVPNGYCNRHEGQPNVEPPAEPEAAEVEEASREHDDAHEHPEPVEVFAAPTSNKEVGLFGKFTAALKGGAQPGIGVVHGADGARYMLIVTSNSYMDREGETIRTEALQKWVDKCWDTVEGEFATDNPLLFWHDDRLKMGDIVWADMRGPFLMEVARESEGAISKALFDYVEQNPDEKWGASHRFVYHQKDRSADGVYGRIIKRETTVLPREFAANPLTYSGVLPMSKSKRAEYLDKMLRLEGAAALLDEGVDKLVSALEANGVQHKSSDKPAETGESKGLNILIGDLIEAQAELVESMDALKGQIDSATAEKVTAEKALADERAQAAESLKQLSERIAQLEVQLKARPVSASRDASTEVNPSSVPADLKKSLTDYDDFFGARVRNP